MGVLARWHYYSITSDSLLYSNLHVRNLLYDDNRKISIYSRDLEIQFFSGLDQIIIFQPVWICIEHIPDKKRNSSIPIFSKITINSFILFILIFNALIEQCIL